MPDETEPRFEVAISQLEAIVASLERGEPELATALTQYETGVRLLSRCYALLERAERSVAPVDRRRCRRKPDHGPL